MAHTAEAEDTLDLLKRSLHTIRVLREDLNRRKKGDSEPIAVIGTACRFPGGCSSPETFWEFLTEGRNGLRDVPPERWDSEYFYNPDPEVSGKIYVNKAGFLLEDIAEFDAGFFGISPREAVEMDPQQRLLLEVSWEALERTGVANRQLKGSLTGVFLGTTGSEYGTMSRKIEEIGTYTATGVSANIASGRIAHILGIHGPAISIDTACSSSLVAVHLACESLKRRECNMALAGGVSLMLSPATFVALCKTKALAADGRCKTFDASGDGFGRAEGCGMIVLKRLSDALRDKENILAIIRGSAVNQDGPTSGLTVPNGRAQKELILRALEKSNTFPDEISYIEAHGTGTALGDPIELQAISEIFSGKRNQENPLIIGAVKSNIGHLEAAAGVAGLIKVILCIQHKQIPPNLHLETVNPRINFKRIPAIVPTELFPWNSNEKPRVCGISSFGFSGTNAHLIVSEAPKKEISPNRAEFSTDIPLHVLALSAKDSHTLNELVKGYAGYLEDHLDQPIGDICHSANSGRMHFPNRVAFMAKSTKDIHEQLKEFLLPQSNSTNTSKQYPFITGNVKNDVSPKIVYLFTNESNEISGAVKTVYENQPIFREALELCDSLFRSYLNDSILAFLCPESGANATTGNQKIAEACSFSIKYAFTQLWDSWGIRPAVVFGEGVGEFVSACVAGIMSLETAVKYISQTRDHVVEIHEIKGGLFPPKIQFVSGNTGKFADKAEVTESSYWLNRSISVGTFEKGMQYLFEQGYRCFMEIGIGKGFSEQTAPYDNVHYMPPVNQERLWETLLRSVSKLYCLGAEIHWEELEPDHCRYKRILPTYPFQRRRYWLDSYPLKASGLDPKLFAANNNNNVDPLQGDLVPSPLKEIQFEFHLSAENLKEVKDNHNVVHIGYYLEMLSRASEVLYNNSTYKLKGMEFFLALKLDNSVAKKVHLIINQNSNRREFDFKFYSKGNSETAWTLHAQGSIVLNENTSKPLKFSEEIEKIKERCTEQCSNDSFYQMIQDRDLHLGNSVKWVKNVWYKEGEALACFRKEMKGDKKFIHKMKLHPGILDACGQLFLVAGSKHIASNEFFMGVKVEEFEFNNRQKNKELWCYLMVQEEFSNNGIIQGEFWLLNEKGLIVAAAKGLRVKKINLADAQQFTEKTRFFEKPGKNHLWLQLLRNVPNAKQQAILQQLLHESMALRLKMQLSELDVQEPLRNLGMDSLIALEFKSVVEKNLNINVPIEIVIQGPSIEQIADYVFKLFCHIPQRSISESIKPENTRGYELDSKLWFAHRLNNNKAKIRLFCFPYGGGGASLYRGWQNKMPDYVEVCPIQLPGRENRLKENSMYDIKEVIDELEKVLLTELDRPYAFYGHSMGALIAFRLAYRLWEKSEIKPKHLFVGASTSPEIFPNPLLKYFHNRFKDEGFQGIPEPWNSSNLSRKQASKMMEILKVNEHFEMDEELVRIMLPLMLSDLKIMESYTYQKETVFNVPITGFLGQNDTYIMEEEMSLWKELTTSSFKQYLLPGDHFFLNETQDQSKLINIISQELGDYV